MTSSKSQRNKITILITLFLIVSITARLVYLLHPFSRFFSRSYDYDFLENSYLHSQYVQEINPSWIPDEGVYSYAAGNYLQGGNPVLVDPSQPPLGKYFIGLSIILFS